MRTSSGNLITDRGTISRALEFSMEYMNQDDKAALNNIFRFAGKSQPLFVSYIPEIPISEKGLSQQIYGKLENNLTVTHPIYRAYNASLRIVEV